MGVKDGLTKCAILTFFLSSPFLLLLSGTNAKLAVFVPEPEADFRVLGPVCRIHSIAHHVDEIGDSWLGDHGLIMSTLTCHDVYTYTFSVRDAAGLHVAPERLQRSCRKGDPARPSSYSAGERVMCWQAVDSGVPLSEVYRCDNATCIKIFDPANDVCEATKHADEWLIYGTILLACHVLPALALWRFCLSPGAGSARGMDAID